MEDREDHDNQSGILMELWYNNETGETRRSRNHPAGFGWILQTERKGATDGRTSGDDPQGPGDDLAESFLGTALEVAIGLAINNFSSEVPGPEFAPGGGNFGGGGSDADY